MVYETRYRVITIDRDDGDRLVYALSPDGWIIPLHAQRNEGATATAPDNLRSLDDARRNAHRREASDAQLREALPLAAWEVRARELARYASKTESAFVTHS